MTWPKRRSKYGNKRVKVEGDTFDSLKEACEWRKLKLMEACGEIECLDRQVNFSLVVNGVLVCKYRADFVWVENGKKVVADAKGFMTKDAKIKLALMKAVYGIEVQIL